MEGRAAVFIIHTSVLIREIDLFSFCLIELIDDRPIELSAIYTAPWQVEGVKKILITIFAFLAIVPFSSPAAELTILRISILKVV